MADLVTHMAERLKDGADGKPLKFKQSTVSNLVEFLSNFSFRNVIDDRQLQDLVGRARDLLQGVAADDLRTSGDMRIRVRQGMAALAADVDGMLVKAEWSSKAGQAIKPKVYVETTILSYLAARPSRQPVTTAGDHAPV